MRQRSQRFLKNKEQEEKIPSFDTFGAKNGRLFTQQSVFKLSSQNDFWAKID